MPKKHKGIKIVLLTIVGLLGLCYIGLAYYYSHSFAYIDSKGQRIEPNGEKCFSYGTYINGIYATGMTVEQVERELESSCAFEDSVFRIDDKLYKINLEEISFSYDYHEPLVQYLDKQNPYLWFLNLFNDVDEMNVYPSCKYDSEAFEKAFDKLNIPVADIKSQDVYIELTDDGFILFDGKKDILKLDMVKQAVEDNLKNGMFDTQIDESFYEKFEYSKDEKRLMEYYERLSKEQTKELNYVFGSETKSISKYDWDNLFFENDTINKITSGMLDVNGNVEGINFEPDKEKCEAFIYEFLDEYNTYHNRHFMSHKGIEVYVDTGTYGNQIDMDKESEWFYGFVKGEINTNRRAPIYTKEANYKEKNDFGSTFIEVSIDEQNMWYYVDGKVYIDTPITSGALSHGGTAPRVAFVYDKIPNKWLTGPTWHSFVKYWVPIQGAIGIHDASWRSEYGGQEYKYNGSHGCINTPLEAMEKLYEHVEIGTPVIVYSFEKNSVENMKKEVD